MGGRSDCSEFEFSVNSEPGRFVDTCCFSPSEANAGGYSKLNFILQHCTVLYLGALSCKSPGPKYGLWPIEGQALKARSEHRWPEIRDGSQCDSDHMLSCYRSSPYSKIDVPRPNV